MKRRSKQFTPTSDQIRHHYEVEKELADKLRNSTKEERRTLYSSTYNDLYLRVPFHPQLVQKASSVIKAAYVHKQIVSLKRFLSRQVTFLELGPGDCALSLELCKLVKQVYAVDVSDEITKDLEFPANFRLFLSDGSSIPLPANTVDLAYSHQLMEHLHPDDAYEQLKNIHTVLVKGGKYFCITPNRSNGPHDISKYFDDVASGFHLKEYTVKELSSLFRKAGFSSVKACVGSRSWFVTIPVSAWAALETVLNWFPVPLRRSVLVRPFLQNRLIATK